MHDRARPREARNRLLRVARIRRARASRLWRSMAGPGRQTRLHGKITVSRLLSAMQPVAASVSRACPRPIASNRPEAVFVGSAVPGAERTFCETKAPDGRLLMSMDPPPRPCQRVKGDL